MWFGHHPLPGVINDDLEIGASMVVSQDPRGGLAVLFFPFESLNVKNNPLGQVEAAFRSAHAHPGERVCVNCEE